MKFKDHFSDVAQAYARARPAYPPELFKFLAEIAPARKRAWDCATGSGQAAIGLSEWFEEVQATDASPDQIAQSIGRENITYSVQLAEKTEFADKSFDLVNVATALHWFDLDRFYGEVCRLLKPQGILAIYSHKQFHIRGPVGEIIRQLIFEPVEPFWPAETRLIRAEYRSIPFPFDEVPAPQLRMNLDWDFDDLKTYLGTWSAVRNFIREFGPQPMQSALEEVAKAWGTREMKRPVTMDMVARIGRLRGNAV